ARPVPTRAPQVGGYSHRRRLPVLGRDRDLDAHGAARTRAGTALLSRRGRAGTTLTGAALTGTAAGARTGARAGAPSLLAALGRTIHPIGDDEIRQVRPDRVAELLRQAVEVLIVDVDPLVAVGIHVAFAAVHGQVRRPAPVERARAVVLVGIEDAV